MPVTTTFSARVTSVSLVSSLPGMRNSSTGSPRAISDHRLYTLITSSYAHFSTFHLIGNVLGIYVHGLFEDVDVMRALFGASVPTLDSVFEGLADYIEKHFEPGVLQALITQRK